MQESYTPPEMPPFPRDYEGVLTVIAPYYHDERPFDFFFEMYVVDVLELPPAETKSALAAFSARFPNLFREYDGDWRAFVVGTAQLSDTIEIAIWDLWIRNSENARRAGWIYHPWHFAQNFIDNYTAEDSRVDVWPEGALEAAKKRIEDYRNRPRH